MGMHAEPYREDGELGFTVVFDSNNGKQAENRSFDEWMDYFRTDKDERNYLQSLANEMFWETVEVPLPSKPDLETVINPGLFDDILREMDELMVFVDNRQYTLEGCWAVDTYLKEELRFSPRNLIYGSTRSGKTHLLDFLTMLCHRGHDYSNPSVAALYRDIEAHGPTICIDSWQRINDSRSLELEWVWEKGFTKGGTVARVGENNKVERFKVYSWLAVATKQLPKPEDLINRSILIGMAEGTPQKRTFDKEVFADFQGQLLSLRIATFLGKIDMKSLREEALKVALDYEPHLDSRALDIAESLLVPAMIFKSVDKDAILDIIAESQGKAIQALRETREAEVFFALEKIVNEKKKQLSVDGESVVDISKICTRDVADQLNSDLDRQGNATKDKIHTKKVSSILRTLGYDLKVGGSDNKSFLGAARFWDVHKRNHTKFGPRGED